MAIQSLTLSRQCDDIRRVLVRRVAFVPSAVQLAGKRLQLAGKRPSWPETPLIGRKVAGKTVANGRNGLVVE